MQVIYAHEHPVYRPKLSMFLAGPSPRSDDGYNWRSEALRILNRIGFTGTVYVPLPGDGNWSVDYDAQIDWENQYLDDATVIAFWIPRDLANLPGFTTNVEFGMYLKSGKIVLGYPEGAAKIRYLDGVARRNNVPVSIELEDTLRNAMALAHKLVEAHD